MTIAKVKNIDWADQNREQLKIIINAKGSEYIEEPKGVGFPQLRNCSHLIEGVNYILEFGYEAVNAMKGNKEFTSLSNEVRGLRTHIVDSELAARVRQFLSALDYGQLTDFQAKCALLLERELK